MLIVEQARNLVICGLKMCLIKIFNKNSNYFYTDKVAQMPSGLVLK